ncbi:glycosyltransferase family 4 protein [Saccharolobus islandicus]|uniref:Glycosyl transferase group 1 n=1 Tax=Saccharolobus islandicus (strain REY15A) TaxID=930945 RepID=F0NDZ3_SACI5|nr:glycosyltransferase family 4 protein [Sulfolobus islandicus]ADX84929.1 glycosyl transferase group 1 [Sulfolobus islandicus REY15A]
MFEIIYKSYDWDFINKTINSLKNENIKLILDLNYWPISYNLIRYLKRDFRIDGLSFLLGESYYYAKKLKVRSAVLLQGMGLHKTKLGIPYNLLRYLKIRKSFPIDIFLSLKSKLIYTIYKGIRENLISDFIKHSNIIQRIYGVSQGQLESLRLSSSKKAIVIDPPFAIEREILTKRRESDEKKDYLAFYARLIPLKGILELPYIVKEIIERTGYKELKTLVMGKFPNDDFKKFFFSIVSELKLEDNIVYKGYLPRDELFDIISRARCIIYPSHEDSFSLAMLEAIVLGTPVVAYDIPGPRSVYGGLSAVRFVNEYDIKSMAIEVSKILKLSDDEYNSIISNDKINKSIEKYTNSDLVAEKYYMDLTSLL